MALSPLDIHNKEFSSKMRGYDKDEVNDFLAQIVKDYSSLIKDNEGLKKNWQMPRKRFSTSRI